ncbi:hypothetical protein [Xaviernesmea oryzae]|uniref:hypothetical protein n=1 Tax=Xaviernesmea oryzae TaxID=464029 RepID=UPI0008CD36E5|nr:hypothetical protein [Xaviernesmea oryzae]SEK22580.1 hypothetical protein SAMN04487976_101137 [Xaviernesmea oryzae]
MTLAGLAGFLRPATVFINENNTVAVVSGALRVLRVSRKPQREKKINEINACGLRVLAALRAGFSTRKRTPPVGAPDKELHRKKKTQSFDIKTNCLIQSRTKGQHSYLKRASLVLPRRTS